MWKQDFKFKNPFIAFSNFFIIILIHYIHCSGTLIWGLEIKVDLISKKIDAIFNNVNIYFPRSLGFCASKMSSPVCSYLEKDTA